MQQRKKTQMPKIMFLCTGNTCRSQMAEGITQHYGKGIIEPYSAGLMPTGRVHPLAISVMKEINIDISDHKSKGIDEQFLNTMDLIITLCGNAEGLCPMTPSHIKRLHWPVDDPVHAEGSDEEIMNKFRAARDEIKNRILSFIMCL
ncbi:MAG: arsenate reductase ArsC [Nitrospirae bacterium]|nr:arsenate reductase ArsC [Nitrospirota bacterium]